MLTSPRVSLEPVGFVDDDKMKKGAVIHGVRVLGEVAQIPELVAEYRVQEVIILAVSEVEPGHADRAGQDDPEDRRAV
ncbi:MAG: hypothetical protein C0393_07590 [Anaerolinea sp.]|nr:hypothetical protein [Anaerolinea sp.]